MKDSLLKARIRKIYITTVLIVVGFGQLFPIIWVVDFSFCKKEDLFASGILKWPDPFQFENYVSAWNIGKVPQFFVNSVIVTLGTIIITVVLSLTMSYAFVKMKWKLRNIFLGFILLGMMIPIHSTLLPNFLVFKRIGFLDTYQGLIIPYVAFALPLGVYLMSGFLESVPVSIEESAVIDGCNVYNIIFRIIFPITKPAIVTITVMTFLNCWNEFIMALTFLSKDYCKTLPFSVLNFTGLYSSGYSIQFAVMALTALPAIIVYILLNEQITKGITVGAVKG